MHNAAFFIKYKIHHVLFWMLVFGLWYMFRHDGYASEALAFKITLLKVVDLALMVYVTNYLLIPFLLYKKRYALFLVVFIAMILTSSVTKMYIIGQLANDPATYSLRENLRARVYDNVLPHFFLVTAGAAIKFMFDQLRLQKKIADLAKEKAEAELNFLKSQINPHFLFNSLNSVYFLIDKNNPEARQALHKFSDMLRYQLYELNGAKIPVEREVTYLRDYVDLQKLRKDEHYTVEFTSSPSVKGFAIEPLLLVPFVENAFKHISHFPSKSNYVKLEMHRENGHFTFTAENSKEPAKTTERPGGIGLVNVKRRLELLYPGKHTLSIQNDTEKYKVELTLKLDE